MSYKIHSFSIFGRRVFICKKIKDDESLIKKINFKKLDKNAEHILEVLKGLRDK
jgi:hypothetical protein